MENKYSSPLLWDAYFLACMHSTLDLCDHQVIQVPLRCYMDGSVCSYAHLKFISQEGILKTHPQQTSAGDLFRRPPKETFSRDLLRRPSQENPQETSSGIILRKHHIEISSGDICRTHHQETSSRNFLWRYL